MNDIFKVDVYDDDYIDVKTELMTVLFKKTDDSTIITAVNLGGDEILGKIVLLDNEVKQINKDDPQCGMEKDEQWEEVK